MAARQLSSAQAARLKRLTREDPHARVIGWDDGPVLRRGVDGRLCRITGDGLLAVVRPVHTTRGVVPLA